MIVIDFRSTTLSVRELAKRYSRDARDLDGQSMLWAAKTIPDAKFLIDVIGVPVDILSVHDEVPCFYSKSTRDAALVDYLIHRGVPLLKSKRLNFATTTLGVRELAKKYNKDYRDSLGRSMLWAAKTVKDAKFLIEEIGVPVDILDVDKESPVIYTEDTHLADYLISKGVPKIGSFNGSFKNDEIDNMRVFVQKFRPDVKDSKGRSILWAAKTVDDARFLIEEYNVNMFALDYENRTILFSIGYVELLPYLFSIKSDKVTERHVKLYGHQPWFIGNDRNTVEIQGNSVRHIDHESINLHDLPSTVLETNPHIPVLTEFIRQYKANINRPGILESALDNIDILKLFISLEIPIPNDILNRPDLAADDCRELIKAGANVNSRNMSGMTPLMIARNQRTIETLLDSGPDTNAIDDIYRKTAMFHQSDENRLVMLRRGYSPYIKFITRNPITGAPITNMEIIKMRDITDADKVSEFYRVGLHQDGTEPFYLRMVTQLLLRHHPIYGKGFIFPVELLKKIIKSLNINIHSTLVYKITEERKRRRAERARQGN